MITRTLPSGSFPGYWMHETSGVLRPAVEAYLTGVKMTGEQIAAMRAYLRQWIMAGAWQGDEVQELRDLVNRLSSRPAIEAWLELAEDIGIAMITRTLPSGSFPRRRP